MYRRQLAQTLVNIDSFMVICTRLLHCFKRSFKYDCRASILPANHRNYSLHSIVTHCMVANIFWPLYVLPQRV